MPVLLRDMATSSKILFVVEGERTERQLVNRLSEVFDVSSEIFAVRGNIYKLYQAVKTDPERGKLLVNYPMVESFRDCDHFFDMSYADAVVTVESLRAYKNHVASRRLVRFHIKDYLPTNFSDLIRMNVFKLNKIVRGSFGACPYCDFLSINDQRKIAKKESDMVRQDSVVSVLNTLLFFPLEYFGNANGFYDKVLEMP